MVRAIERASACASLLVGAGALVLVGTAGSCVGGGGEDARLRERLWGAAGLPRDLPDHVDHLTELRLPAGVEELRWLGSSLVHLEVAALGPDVPVAFPSRLRSFGSSGQVAPVHLDRLPRQVTGIHLPFSRLGAWPELPPRLVELQLAGVDELGDLPGSVQRLSLGGMAVDDLWRLPEVEVLELGGHGIRGVEGLSSSVRSLALRDTWVRSLALLPDTLQDLTLVRNRYLDPVDPATLPRYLISLTVERQTLGPSVAEPPGEEAAAPRPAGRSWPRYLRVLRLGQESWLRGDARRLPTGLSELETRVENLDDLATLPVDLERLELDFGQVRAEDAPAALAALPESIESLALIRLPSPGLDDLRGIPRGVRHLDLSGSHVGVLSALPAGLETLVFKDSDLAQLPPLPEGLKALDLNGSGRLRSLGELRALEHLRELRIGATRIESTAGLPASLRVLDVAGASISKLEGLPPELEELRFASGQLETLEGLPDSVERLIVEDGG